MPSSPSSSSSPDNEYANLSPVDKKLAKKAKREKEKQEKDAAKAAAAAAGGGGGGKGGGMKAARAAALAALVAEEGEGEGGKEGKMEESGSRKEDEEGREEGGEDEEDAELMVLLNQGGGPDKKKKEKKGGKGGGKGGREGGREGGMTMAVEEEEIEGLKEEKNENEEKAPWKSGNVGNKEQLRAEAAAAVDSGPPPSASSSLPLSAPPLDRGPLPPDPPAQVGPTLEEKARASRPPPRVRIMSDGTAAAGTTFVRLDKINVIFRNQEVIKDASWGVQTGERVGLVGPNGGGKTTQLKVLAGELDPTSGEVLKSSQNVKIAFLRQEFTDELDLARTLKEEMLSVFGEEQEILTKLRALEGRLEDGKEGREGGREGRCRCMNKMNGSLTLLRPSPLPSLSSPPHHAQPRATWTR